jgi:outer membrane protein OmpA-like peptidoglycan-associated protein/preprotein translocase subunit SecG
MSFCTQCGTARAAGSKFCTGCGAPQPPLETLPSAVAPPSPPSPPAPTYAPVSAPYVSGGVTPLPAARKSNTLLKVVIAILVVLFIGAGLVLAGLYYAAQKVKQKMHEVRAQVMEEAPRPATPGAPQPRPAASSFTPWQPGSSGAQGSSSPAPLKPGMLVVTAVADTSGDYESMKQIVSLDKTGNATLSYHADQSKGGPNGQGQAISVTRKVLAQDMNSAHDYSEIFSGSDPMSFPGTTAISASREVLADLKQKGTTPFSFRPEGLAAALGSLMTQLSALGGGDNKTAGGGSLGKLGKIECNLQRVGSGLFAFPVLLNAQPVTLPALRADCTTDDGAADFYILDQPDYPLMLAWKLGSGSQLQVIKITYPSEPAAPRANQQAPPANSIEQQLKEKKKVDIYGIYFDFASDRLKPESTPVLEEIVGVLKDNSDWKLTVSGHTDNVGGDVYNLDLSKRRAAAVKQALVTEYHIAPERLSTDGFGASRPIDTNDTLAGRARNRRVELTRE